MFNPVAPTEECIDFMRDLESKCGPVKFIVLSSLALEHKGTAGAFATFFPKSSIYVQPGQFSFPVNLPTNFFFPFGKQIKEIPSNSSQAPWYGDLDHAVLSVQPSPVGGFGETAFFHRASKTLLVTDTIVKVTLFYYFLCIESMILPCKYDDCEKQGGCSCRYAFNQILVDGRWKMNLRR